MSSQNWFEAHTYVAAWLALPIAMVGPIVQAARVKPFSVDWNRFLLNTAFVICLCAAVSPGFDQQARSFAEYTAGGLVGYLIVDRIRR